MTEGRGESEAGGRTPVALASPVSAGEPVGQLDDPVRVAVAVGRALGVPALCALEDLGPLQGRTRARPAVTAALALPVGVALGAAVAALLPATLSTRERLDVAAAARRCEASASGLVLAGALGLSEAMEADAEEAARAGAPQRWGQRSGIAAVGNELGPALAIAPRTASGIASLATFADTRTPAAFDALLSGTVHRAQLEVLVAVARSAPPALDARLQAETLRHPTWTPSRLRTHLQQLAAQLDPTAAEQAAEADRAARDVWGGPFRKPGCRKVSPTCRSCWPRRCCRPSARWPGGRRTAGATPAR